MSNTVTVLKALDSITYEGFCEELTATGTQAERMDREGIVAEVGEDADHIIDEMVEALQSDPDPFGCMLSILETIYRMGYKNGQISALAESE